MMRRLRRVYGAGPLHLLTLAGSLVIAAAAIVRWFDPGEDAPNIAIWFGGAIIAHDLVLLPLYSLLGRIVNRRRRRTAGRSADLRIPAALSLLLGLISLPVIAGLGRSSFHDATGHYQHGYLTRWLIATAVLFIVSALAHAARRVRGRPRAPQRRSDDG